MKITIQNCNNIDKGVITLAKSKLNIKYGINGTGKSTIAKAIQFSANDPDKLEELLPFKLQDDNPENLQPKINIDNGEDLKSTLVFNEEYLNQFIYKEDELISNSFEIFIKTPQYVKIVEDIDKQLERITNIFSRNTDLDKIISDFESLSKSFKTTNKGLSDASAISKGLKDGNKIENIPDGLSEYKPFLQNKEKCIGWLDWQIKGNHFSDGHDNCPYCVSPNDEAKKIKIKSISENYDKNVIKNFMVTMDAIEDLGDYFSDSTKQKLNEILIKTNGLLDEEKIYIGTIKGQIDSFLQRLKDLRDVSFKNFKDDERVSVRIQGFIICIDELFDKLKSTKTEEIVNSFNDSLKEILKEIGILQGNVNKQKKEVQKLITKHEKDINQFLQNAGYKYNVVIIDEEGEYKIKLQHNDSRQNISRGNQYLSFGEKNAFALVLFMYQVLSEKPDLIILDDPISSFDKNKKYAIMNMLFRTDECLKNKTVLMLTHDIEPIIDTIKALREFRNLINADFLFFRGGKLEEKSIKKGDLLTFPQICRKVIDSENVNSLIKSIYLRRYYEVIANKGNEYQVISNLLHGRAKEMAEDHSQTEGNKAMSSDDFDNGVEKIQKIFSDFNYDRILDIISNKDSVKELYNSSGCGYEKLQLFRLLKDDTIDSILKKCINESYHIENEFIYQLNPMDFDLIPLFIIDACDEVIQSDNN
jgi:energy-coupling factor transporter ATP-binding protein EcfA2